jgi:Ricin-type beta-trefoil lectin domain-like
MVLLFNDNNKKLIAVTGMSRDNGAAITQWSDNGTIDHYWTFMPVQDGFAIINANSGKRLASTMDNRVIQTDVADLLSAWTVEVDYKTCLFALKNKRTDSYLATANNMDGTPLSMMWVAGPHPQCWWRLQASSHLHAMKIKNDYTGKFLTIRGQSREDQSAVTQWVDYDSIYQTWFVEEIYPHQFKITNKFTQYHLTAAATDQRYKIIQQQKLTQAGLWQIKHLKKNGSYECVTFENCEYKNKVLTPLNWNTDNDTELLLFDNNGTEDHLWQMLPYKPTERTYYWIINHQNEYALSVLPYSNEPNSAVHTTPCVLGGASHQLWYLENGVLLSKHTGMQLGVHNNNAVAQKREWQEDNKHYKIATQWEITLNGFIKNNGTALTLTKDDRVYLPHYNPLILPTEGQLWHLVPYNPATLYTIRHQSKDVVFDIYDFNPAVRAKVGGYTQNYPLTANQLWYYKQNRLYSPMNHKVLGYVGGLSMLDENLHTVDQEWHQENGILRYTGINARFECNDKNEVSAVPVNSANAVNWIAIPHHHDCLLSDNRIVFLNAEKQASNHTLIYNDRGSKAKMNVKVNRPQIGYFVGDCAEPNYNQGYSNPLLIPSVQKLHPFSSALRPPIRYDRVWDSSGMAGSQASIWRAIPPRGYVAIGDIASNNLTELRDVANYVCVRRDLVKAAKLGTKIWDTEGSAALHQGILMAVEPIQDIPTNTFHFFRSSLSDWRQERMTQLYSPHIIDTNNWMKQVRRIHKLPLKKICFPATHDSGTYALTPKMGNQTSELLYKTFKLMESLKSHILNVFQGVTLLDNDFKKGLLAVATAQHRTIYQQLNDGIRAFDLRLYFDIDQPNGDKSFFIHHGLIGPSLQTVLDDIVRFVNENDGEILFVNMGHFGNFTEDRHNFFTQWLLNMPTNFGRLSNHTFTTDRGNPFNTTYETVIGADQKTKIIWVYDDSVHGKLKEKKYFFPGEYTPVRGNTDVLDGAYTNSPDYSKVVAEQQSNLTKKRTDPKKKELPFALYLTVTLSDEETIAGTVGYVIRDLPQLLLRNPEATGALGVLLGVLGSIAMLILVVSKVNIVG